MNSPVWILAVEQTLQPSTISGFARTGLREPLDPLLNEASAKSAHDIGPHFAHVMTKDAIAMALRPGLRAGVYASPIAAR